jgi:hypothetical protein
MLILDPEIMEAGYDRVVWMRYWTHVGSFNVAGYHFSRWSTGIQCIALNKQEMSSISKRNISDGVSPPICYKARKC